MYASKIIYTYMVYFDFIEKLRHLKKVYAYSFLYFELKCVRNQLS